MKIIHLIRQITMKNRQMKSEKQAKLFDRYKRKKNTETASIVQLFRYRNKLKQKLTLH